ncbi:unnamed protein product [Malus baccata var. baccata]
MANLMEDNWRRIGVIAPWISIFLDHFTSKFIQYKNRAMFDVMGYCVFIAKGGAETLKFNMALILLPICRNSITWVIAFGILVGVELYVGSHLTCDFCRPLHSTDDEFKPIKLFYRTNWPDDYWWFVFSIVLQWCLYIAFNYNLAMSIYCHRCRCIRLFQSYSTHARS